MNTPITKLLVLAIALLIRPVMAQEKPADTRADAAALAEFKAKLHVALGVHLNHLISSDGKLAELKGKSSDSMTAMALYLLFEITAQDKYRLAALQSADRILARMKAMKFGVLYIKEKETDKGETIGGGGPPAFGWYCSALAYIYSKQGGRDADLKYLAQVVDQYPWNEQGWWSSSIDVLTGISKVEMTKPSIINKNACMALAAGVISQAVAKIDPELSARLKQKTEQCIYKQILPAQQPDGYWNYSLTGNDPKNKDILGYYMLTTSALMQLRELTGQYDDPALTAALARAAAFCHSNIAPMTDPNTGPPCPVHRTPSTPDHFKVPEDSKRAFELGHVLFAGGYTREGIKIMQNAIDHFPTGEVGEDGAHAAQPSALILLQLSRPAAH